MARKKYFKKVLPCVFIILGPKGVHLIPEAGDKNEYQLFGRLQKKMSNLKGACYVLPSKGGEEGIGYHGLPSFIC